MEDRDYMLAALELAKEAAAEGEVPVGCVITRNGEIVGRGRNRREQGKNALCHAELEAINEACTNLGGWRLWECTLYVTVEPCLMCAGAIAWSQLRRIVIGAADPKRGYSTMTTGSPFHPKAEVVTGVLGDECAELMTKFFKQRRKK